MEPKDLARPPAIPLEFRAIIRSGDDPAEFRSQSFERKTFEEVIQSIERDGNRVEVINPREDPAILAHEPLGDSWISLPVIRRSHRRSFQLEGLDSVAVFRTGIALFETKQGADLPKQAFSIEESEAIANIPGARKSGSFQWDEIVSMTARRKNTEAFFVLNLGKKTATFSIPLKEARSLVEACACFLGARFQSSILQTDFLVKDISGRKRTILGIIALAVSALTVGWGSWLMTQEGNDWAEFGLVPVQYGIIGSLFSLLFLGGQWMKRPSTRPAGVDPYRSRPLSLVLKLSGITVFVVGYIFPESILKILGLTNSLASYPILLTLSIVTISLGALLLYAGYRVGLGTNLKSKKPDDRLPILYLRSFGDDGRYSLNPQGFYARILGLRPFSFLENFGPVAHAYPPRMIKLLLGIAADTAEEQLGIYFRKHGPFRAIGKPGERLATGGADRVYVGHDTWQEEVIGLMDRSRAVVLQPAATEGVWWEIEKAIKRVGPRRLILCLANFKDSIQDYDDFRQRFQKMVGAKLPRSLYNSHFMYFTDAAWTPRLLESVPRNPLLWPVVGVGIDLERTLHPFLSQLPEPPSGLPAEVKVVSQRIWPRALAAVIIWGLILQVGIFSTKTWFEMRQLYQGALAEGGFEINQVYPGYTWRLGDGWTELRTGIFGPQIFASENQAIIAVVEANPASATLDSLLESQMTQLDKISLMNPQITDKRVVTIDGKKWIMAEIRSRIFSDEDMQIFVTRENLSRLSIDLLNSVDQEAALARATEMDRPYRESLDASELATKTRSGKDFVHYVACHAGDQNDFSLRMSASARGCSLGGASRELFLARLGTFRILPEPTDSP
jgi:hypothetical protein